MKNSAIGAFEILEIPEMGWTTLRDDAKYAILCSMNIKTNNGAHAVHVVRCANYGESLAPAFARLLEESHLLSESAARGRKVLVKPNLLTDRTPDKAVTTHPELLRLVIRHLKSVGAIVSVGDSPASAANLKNVLERTGVGDVCRDEDVPFVSFEQAGACKREANGFQFTIARSVVEADLIVSMPKVKSHSLTKLTAAVKNLYGAVPGYCKTTLHRLHPRPDDFGRLLKAIWCVLPQTISIADAVVGMEGQGPANGRPAKLGFIAASADPFALDIALCEMLHIRSNTVPYLAGEAKTHAPELSGDKIEIASFDVPVGSHLIGLVPTRLAKMAASVLWVRPRIDDALCIGCGKCAKACPAEALVMQPGGRRKAGPSPTLDRRRCVGCACCHEVCPKGAIKMVPSPLLRLFHAFHGID